MEKIPKWTHLSPPKPEKEKQAHMGERETEQAWKEMRRWSQRPRI
jgi:hypothetical protein